MMRPAASSGETAKSAFLPTKESRGRRLVHSFTEDGVAGVLELLAGEGVAKGDEEQVGVLSQFLAKISRVLLAAWRLTSSLHGSFNPHLLMSFQEMITEFCPTLDWQNSPVRCLAWHPHTAKLGVALQDDSIHVHSSQQLVKPVLKHAGQRAVNCMAWKPCGASELAVGCQAGVLLWHVDPASVVSRPSTSCVTKLFRAGHTPVTGVCWDPNGKLLVSCSPADTSMLVWSPASEVATPLRRVGGGGVSLVKWSPDGSKLFAATPGRTFRVWSCLDWSPERWTVGGAKGRVCAAAWSPTSDHLVFATTDEAVLYAMSLVAGLGDAAVPVLDLGKVALEMLDGEDILGGGLVQDITWDPTGQRLAISFRSTPLIALLSVRTGTCLSLAPLGWVRGREGEAPSCLQFQAGGCAVGGAMLTVGWSSGRVQHVPLVFQPGVMTGARGEEARSQLFSVD